jgi:hypothetical protein
MDNQINELFEKYFVIFNTFEKRGSEELCMSIARTCKQMYDSLIHVGFDREQAMSLLCAMSNNFKRGNN